MVGWNVKRQIPFQKSEIFLDIKAWDTNFFVDMITLSKDDIWGVQMIFHRNSVRMIILEKITVFLLLKVAEEVPSKLNNKRKFSFQYQPKERAYCKTLHQSLQMLHPVTIDMQSYEKRRRETKGWILLKALNVHLKCLNVCKAVFLLVIIMWFPNSLNFENRFLKVWNILLVSRSWLQCITTAHNTPSTHKLSLWLIQSD